ncbi:MAG: hypothetical protein L6R39_002825 [Caloplaca ligustica]|nr:MAG: hypothetical protein L6R39_002825 [Caloplaca ligustica]
MGKTTIQVVDRTCGGNFESGKNSSDIGAPRKQRLPTQHGLINRVSSCRGRVAAARGDRCTPASAPTSPPNVTAPASVALISAPAHSASGETSASAPDAVPVNAPSVTEFGHASVPAPVGAASNGTQTPQGQPSSQGQASTQEQQSSLGSSSRRHSPASRGSPSSQRPPTSNAPFSPRVSPLSKGRRSNQKTSEGPQNPEQYKRNFDAREKGIRKYLVYDKGYVPSGSHSESKGSRAGPTGQAQTGSHTSPNVPSSGAIPYPPLEPPSQQPAATKALAFRKVQRIWIAKAAGKTTSSTFLKNDTNLKCKEVKPLQRRLGISTSPSATPTPTPKQHLTNHLWKVEAHAYDAFMLGRPNLVI